MDSLSPAGYIGEQPPGQGKRKDLMRLNVDVSDAQMASLKELQKRTGASTIKELVNNALSMLDWAAEEIANGNEVAAVNERKETYRVLVNPLLQHVKQHSAPRELAVLR